MYLSRRTCRAGLLCTPWPLLVYISVIVLGIIVGIGLDIRQCYIILLFPDQTLGLFNEKLSEKYQLQSNNAYLPTPLEEVYFCHRKQNTRNVQFEVIIQHVNNQKTYVYGAPTAKFVEMQDTMGLICLCLRFVTKGHSSFCGLLLTQLDYPSVNFATNDQTTQSYQSELAF